MKLIKNKVANLSILLVFSCSLLQVILGIGKILFESKLLDFSVYYQASYTFIAGFNPYRILYLENIPFNYPPSSFLFFVPFTFISLSISQWLFTLLSLLSLLASGIIYAKSTDSKLRCRVILLILSALLQNFPTKFTLVMGQVNLIVLLFLSLSFYFDQKNKTGLSGMFLGFASMIKIYPIFTSIYFFSRKKWKTVIIGLILFLGSNVLLYLLLPNIRSYFISTFPNLLMINITSPSIYDQSLQAFITRVGIRTEVSIIFTSTLYLAAIYQHFKITRKKASNRLNDLIFFSLILAITIIGNRFTWQHHLVLLFPGFTVLALIFLKEKNIAKGIVLFISALLVGGHFPDIANPPSKNPFIISHSLIGSFILIALLFTEKLKSPKKIQRQFLLEMKKILKK